MRPNWFIAIPVPAHGWLNQVLDSVPSHVRCFHPGDVHITVAFLGNVGDEAAAQAWRIMEPYQGHPIHVQLGRLGPFGQRSRPSAFSFVLDAGNEAVTELIATYRPLLADAAGSRLDTRSPLPHLTIARPSRRASPDERRAGIRWAESVVSPDVSIRLDRIALYTWSEDRKERQFRIVSEKLWYTV